MGYRRLLAACLVLVSAACGEKGRSPAPAAVITIRDSSGVQIVEHPAGYEDSLPVWEALGAPVVDIGGGEDVGQDLHLVRGAARLSDGRIVVANSGSSELRVFDGTGKYLSPIGRKGQGPGEFESLATVWRLQGDTLVALDTQTSRFSLFSPSGEFVRSSTGMVHSERGGVSPSVRLLDGRVVGIESFFGDMRETSGQVRRAPITIVVIDEKTVGFDTVVIVPGPEIYPAVGSEAGQTFPTLRSLVFGRQTVVTTDGVRIFVGSNEGVGIRIYEPDGRLVRIIRSATPPEPVTEEHRAQRIRENLARLDRQRASEQMKAEWRKNQENDRFADVFPFYERLLVSTDGKLWVERARRTEDEGRRYIVYDTNGKAIATVKCPDRVRPYEVGPTEIVGLWRDPEEVNHVRVYNVRRER